jgi:proline iminopeptidase
MAAAKAWSTWEGRCSTLRPHSQVVNHFASPRFALALARIEAHYFVNHAYLRPNQIIEDAHRLAGIPGIVVHGRYDMVCPIDQAQALCRAWPDAEFDIIGEAGHSATEPGITDALVRATDTMARRLADH